MTVLADTTYEKAIEYKSYGKMFKLVPVTKKDGSEGKPLKKYVFLNVVVDSSELPDGLFSIDPVRSVVKTITFTGEVPEDLVIPEQWHDRVFLKGSKQVVKGAYNLVKCKGTPNLRKLSDKAKKNPTYRFYGGCLLAVDGITVGMFDEGMAKEYGILGKEEPNILFTDGSYDMFQVADFDSIKEEWGDELIKESSTKVKKVATKKKDVVSARPKKPKKDKTVSKVRTAPKPKVNKKKEAFSSIFSQKVEF